MDDVKDKMKGFMKKVNNPFSSSSKFKGQGRVLGSAPNPAAANSSNNNPRHHPPPPAAAAVNHNSNPRHPPPPTVAAAARKSIPKAPSPMPNSHPPSQFDTFHPLISSAPSSSSAAAAGAVGETFACPICACPFPSESAVSDHIDSCLPGDEDPSGSVARESDVAARVAEFVSAGPPPGSVDVMARLLGNVARDPGNEKFRRIRMGNPKIKEAVGDVKGGVELLESVGFRLGTGEDGDDVWATMEAPSDEQIADVKEAVALLENWKVSEDGATKENVVELDEKPVEMEKIDRQIRVFFSAPESEAAKIDLPESFYNLSAEEIKREALLRRKKMEDSRLLIPKSYKEKQLMNARRRYKRTVIRIQFPDGVTLQGVFLPWESTATLYEFVSGALKQPNLEFELLVPAFPKLKVIPFPQPGSKAATMEDEDLVPSALLKFKPLETDSIVFTGLTNELLEASEPLTSSAIRL